MIILYVEDNFENKLFVRRVIESMGHEMMEAENGFDSLTLAAEQKPDLILMDVNIPGMDGLETTTKFKADPGLSDIPIIALTANAMKGDKEKCLAASMNDYISKPIDPGELYRLLFRWLIKPLYIEKEEIEIIRHEIC